jgi:hypothetical protein
MKRVMMLAAAVVTAGSAMADFRPGYERPLYQAELVAMTRTFPLPTQLMVTRADGSNRELTGMILTEHTGIVCVTTPCPSERISQFVVTHSRLLPGNSVEYTAKGNLLVTGPLGRPRVVTRTLTLVDHSNSILHVYRPNLWEVTVRQGLTVVSRAAGNPEPVYTTAGLGFAGEEASEELDVE